MAEHYQYHPDYTEMGIFAGYGEFDDIHESCGEHYQYHPDYTEMGIFAGYGEFDDIHESCGHTTIVSISETDCQCVDCLRVWTKKLGFRSDSLLLDRG